VNGAPYGAFDSTGAGWSISGGGVCVFVPIVYGSGNAIGWSQQKGTIASFFNEGTKPTITGTIEVFLYGKNYTWALIPAALGFEPISGLGSATPFQPWRRFIGDFDDAAGDNTSAVFATIATIPVTGYVADSGRRILAELSAAFYGGAGVTSDNALFQLLATCSVSGDLLMAVTGDSFAGDAAGSFMGCVNLSRAFAPPAGETVTAVKLQIRSTGGAQFVWDEADADRPCGIHLWVSEIGTG
jgi:hypothetical protein